MAVHQSTPLVCTHAALPLAHMLDHRPSTTQLPHLSQQRQQRAQNQAGDNEQVKHEEFKQGADQRAAAQGLEVYRLQEQVGELQRSCAQLCTGADEAARQANLDLQVVKGQIGQMQVGLAFCLAGLCMLGPGLYMMRVWACGSMAD